MAQEKSVDRIEIDHRLARRTEQEIAQVIGDHPINLFRHRAVVRPEASLDVRDVPVQLGCRQRASQGRVRVPVQKHPVRSLCLDPLLERDEHPAGHGSVRSAMDTQVDGRFGESQFGKEHA